MSSSRRGGQLQVSHERSDFLLAAVESRELDACIVSSPLRLTPSLECTHRFRDDFVLILSPGSAVKERHAFTVGHLRDAYDHPRWLLITRHSHTGKRLHAWLEESGLRCEPGIEADNFGFIVNLVSLGLGISLVPHRVLALHPKTRPVVRVRTEPRFSRELVVVVRRETASPQLKGFLENVLFQLGEARDDGTEGPGRVVTTTEGTEHTEEEGSKGRLNGRTGPWVRFGGRGGCCRHVGRRCRRPCDPTRAGRVRDVDASFDIRVGVEGRDNHEHGRMSSPRNLAWA